MERKLSTGIAGFDLLSDGGLPRGRLISVFGGAGTGKTVFALQTLLHRMRDHAENTIFVSFEQPVDDILADVSSFDWDFARVADERLDIVDAGFGSQVVHNGSFDLEGLVAGLSAAVEQSGATTVVLDGVDALLSLLEPERERAEIVRLINWLRSTDVTGIITVKPGDVRARSIARAELLEYQTDCVIWLDTLVTGNTVSRTLRMVKNRGSKSDGERVPMILDSSGISLISPSVPAAASKKAPLIESTRYSTGLPDLDALMEGGYRRGSTTLVSGAPGTAKSTLASAFALACAQASVRTVYISFDETPEQIASHVASVGFDFGPAMESGELSILSLRTGGLPPEVHVQRILNVIDDREALAIVVDPISAIMRSDHPFAHRVVEHLLVELRKRSVTMLCTSLLEGTATGVSESTQSEVSTLADTWIHLSYVAVGGERNRALTIVKSRGTAHSNQVRELLLSASGVTLESVYTADGDVLFGTARLQKEAADRREAAISDQAQTEREVRAERDIDTLVARTHDIERELASKQQELQELRMRRQQGVADDGADREARVSSRSATRAKNAEPTQEAP